MRTEIISFDRLTYVDQGVTYLNQVDLQIFQGEVFGFLSINSQGQNEIVDLLTQNKPIHYGRIKLNGRIVNHYQNSDNSLNPEVYVIDRESKLINGFSVSDNFAVFSKKKSSRIVNDSVNAKNFEIEAEKLGLKIKGNELVDDLSPYHRYALEIMRAVASGALFIVIRDVSNYISQNELTSMFHLMNQYKEAGISFGYFCNHHEEQYLISDRISLWEDGRVIKILRPSEYSDQMMLNYSFDFSVLKEQPLDSAHSGVIKFESVASKNINKLSFSVKPGECVTILDQENEIHSDILQMIQGELRPYSGAILIEGKTIEDKFNDVFFIPEHPIDKSILFEFSFMDNLMMPLNRKAPRLWMKPKVRKSIYREYQALFPEHIDLEDINQLKPSTLYHLIYQRVVLYNPKVVFIMQPFSNADMYLRQDIINLINVLKRNQIAVIILAVNLSDSIFVADRLIFVDEGTIKRIINQEDFGEIMGSVYNF